MDITQRRMTKIAREAAKFTTRTLRADGVGTAEFDLIRYPERGTCLYKCGNERYLLQVTVPPYKAALFGKAGGR